MTNTAQKITLVKAYIAARKGVSVDIIPPQTLEQNVKLDRAYAVAKQFFKI
jgi:hypothetical protein